MEKTIGFIGCGNMGSAMIGGIIKSKVVQCTQIIVSDHSEESFKKVERYGVQTTLSNAEVARQSDILFLTVKPYLYEPVIDEIKNEVKKNVLIVIIAAGKSITQVKEMFNKKIKTVKVMPNTPALVNEAMSAIARDELMSDEDLEDIITLCNAFGKCEVVSENLMDAVTAVSGSSPAYVYMFIEAMADAAVLEGMPRAQAYKFAAQSVLGSAKMVLETGKHPGELKDNVCSPGGTTIESVAVLEKTGMRSSVMEAMKACADKSRKMSK